MITFKEFLSETYLNYHEADTDKKAAHADHVYSMVQKAYEPIGGIHGNGFKSPEDMSKNIHMWKLHKKEGKVVAAALYKKTAQGRKRVAVASDGTPEGKKALGKMMSDDYTRHRAHSEASGPSLKFLKKQIHISDHVKTFEQAKKYHEKNGDEVQRPPHDDPEVVAHPDLKDHFYQRKIGGEWHTKVMLGSLNKDSDNIKTKEA